MSVLNNALTLTLVRGIVGLGSRNKVLGKERVPRSHEGLLLACTHLSHYDPFSISVLLRRKVDWMARAEYFRNAFPRFWVTRCDAFRIDRAGPWLPGVREALRRLDEGRLVGIYPEGDVTRDVNSVLLGAPIKQGAAMLARYSQVPVVPCVVLGSDQFRSVTPWLPLRSGRLWIGFGNPLEADYSMPRGRASRAELTERLAEAMRELYAEMLAEWNIEEHAKASGTVANTA